MKRIIIFTLAFVLAFGTGFAQKGRTDGSKDKSNKTDKNNKKNSVPDTSPDRNDSSDDTDGGGGGNLLKGDIFNVVALLTGKYHKSLLAKDSKVPIIISFEATADAGYTMFNSLVDVNHLNAFPQLRVNYGAYFADVKLDYLRYEGTGVKSEITTANGFLGLNFVGNQNFRAYLGAGVNYDLPSKTYAPQVMLGTDIGFNKRSIVFTPELLYAYDLTEQTEAYSEFGVRGAYRFLKSGHLNLYLNAGGDYRTYGSTMSMIHFYGGIEMLIQ